MNDPAILETIMLAAKALNEIGLIYIHLCEADWDDAPEIPEIPEIPDSFRAELGQRFENTIIATGNKTPDQGPSFVGCKPGGSRWLWSEVPNQSRPA